MRKTGKIILLMTATITPRNCPGAQFEPQERKRRYLQAFAWYLSKLMDGRNCAYDGVVFAENSNSDLSEFEALVPESYRNRQVELISAPANIFPPRLGKNNEFGLIDYAVDNSKLLSGRICGFFKVTGRYYIKNITSLLEDVRDVGCGVELFCDQRDHRLYSTLGIKRVERDGETRFFFSSINFWRVNFYGYFREHPAWRRVEDVMFETAVAHYCVSNCRFRFRHEPLLGGNQFCGKRGDYVVCLGIKMPPRLFFSVCYFRWIIESVLRRVLPSFWF